MSRDKVKPDDWGVNTTVVSTPHPASSMAMKVYVPEGIGPVDKEAPDRLSPNVDKPVHAV